MNVDDRVTRDSVLRVKKPVGSVIKITNDYIIVKWDNINGQWHYTHEQAKKLQPIEDENESR
jgi:hypothetical protein